MTPTRSILLVASVLAIAPMLISAPADPAPHAKLHQLLQEWSILPVIKFDESETALNLELHDNTMGGASLAQMHALDEESLRFVRSVRAGTFASYKNILGFNDRNPLRLASIGKTIMTSRAQALSLLESPEHCSDEELLEAYWVYFTKLGSGNQFFVGFAPKDSRITMQLISTAEAKDYSDPQFVAGIINKTESYSGLIAARTVFERGDRLEAQSLRSGRVLIAFVKIHFRTSKNILSYPVISEYFWSEKKDAWLPVSTFQLYGGKRVDIIY